MSNQLHKSKRKVLLIQKSVQMHDGTAVSVKTVMWCIPDSITSRTVKTRHIAFSVYFGSAKFSGTSGLYPRKAISIDLKNPLAKFFDGVSLKRTLNEASSDAYRAYILGSSVRSTGLTGVVRWFGGDTGCIEINGQEYRVYACNIAGAKTWYPGTACTYLNAGETVTVDLKDMGDHLTCRVTSGGHFDARKWDSLDHSKLAFQCDTSGIATSGLMA